MEDLKINITTENKELIIRTGDAEVIKEPKIVNIKGVLNSPSKWLEKRIDLINQKASHVLVDRDKMTIHLVVEETSSYRTELTGSLELHPTFKKFGINASNYITAFQMADLIKMNRSFFETQAVAMELVTQLKNFKASVDKKIELADNNRGNKKSMVDQVVESNIPATFNINIPIFKGMPKQLIEVEVYFNADDLSCTLVSPSANDIIEYERDSAINEVLEQIIGFAPNLAIIEH